MLSVIWCGCGRGIAGWLQYCGVAKLILGKELRSSGFYSDTFFPLTAATWLAFGNEIQCTWLRSQTIKFPCVYIRVL